MYTLREVRGEHSLRTALSRAKMETIPEALRRHFLVEWISGFDKLREVDSHRKVEAKTEHPGRWKHYESPLVPLFENEVRFYFYSMFHIGRLWRVSELALEALDAAEIPAHLAATVEATMTKLRPRKRRENTRNRRPPSYDDVEGAYRQVFEATKATHVVRLQAAHHLWGLWEAEVESLHKVYGIMRETGQSGDLAHEPLILHMAMIQSGVNLKDELKHLGYLYLG